MSAAKKITLDPSKLYGFRIVANTGLDDVATPAALGAKIGGGKGRAAGDKISAKIGAKVGEKPSRLAAAKISAKIGLKLGFKSRRTGTSHN